MIRRAWEAVVDAAMITALFLLLFLGWLFGLDLED